MQTCNLLRSCRGGIPNLPTFCPAYLKCILKSLHGVVGGDDRWIRPRVPDATTREFSTKQIPRRELSTRPTLPVLLLCLCMVPFIFYPVELVKTRPGPPTGPQISNGHVEKYQLTSDSARDVLFSSSPNRALPFSPELGRKRMVIQNPTEGGNFLAIVTTFACIQMQVIKVFRVGIRNRTRIPPLPTSHTDQPKLTLPPPSP